MTGSWHDLKAETRTRSDGIKQLPSLQNHPFCQDGIIDGRRRLYHPDIWMIFSTKKMFHRLIIRRGTQARARARATRAFSPKLGCLAFQAAEMLDSQARFWQCSIPFPACLSPLPFPPCLPSSPPTRLPPSRTLHRRCCKSKRALLRALRRRHRVATKNVWISTPCAGRGPRQSESRAGRRDANVAQQDLSIQSSSTLGGGEQNRM